MIRRNYIRIRELNRSKNMEEGNPSLHLEVMNDTDLIGEGVTLEWVDGKLIISYTANKDLMSDMMVFGDVLMNLQYCTNIEQAIRYLDMSGFSDDTSIC